MSKIHNNPTINEEKININRNAIEHRATWTGLTYVEGKAARHGPGAGHPLRLCKTRPVPRRPATRPSARTPRTCAALPRCSCPSWG